MRGRPRTLASVGTPPPSLLLAKRGQAIPSLEVAIASLVLQASPTSKIYLPTCHFSWLILDVCQPDPSVLQWLGESGIDQITPY